MSKNLYKKPKQYPKASPIQKANSSKQREINRLHKFIEKYKHRIEELKRKDNQSNVLIKDLLESKRITKEELSKYFIKKRDAQAHKNEQGDENGK